MSTKVIEVEHLYKQYRLGTINHGMLYKDLQSWWARFRGKDDPNTIIDPYADGRQVDSAGHFWALQDISFSLDEGEVLGIIGSNGAGKSTLLKILSRVTSPTQGCVKIRGRVASLLEVGTGFHPELTGRENVYLNGAILGMSKQEIRSKFDEIVSFAEIEKFIDTPVKRYSSGMYVRLAFAVAAHLEPEILVVDEVLAVGDAEFQKKCMSKMGNVAMEGRTILFVSHNMTAVSRLCSTSILLDQGKCVASGSTSDVIEAYLQGNRIKASSFVYLDSIPRWKDNRKKIMTWLSVHKENGDEAVEFLTGEDIIIRIGFEIDQPMTAFCAIHFINYLGDVVMSIRNTHEVNNLVLSGKGFIECVLKDVRLLSGEYGIRPTVGRAFPHEEWLDGFPEASRLRISIGDYLGGVDWRHASGNGSIAQKSMWHTGTDN